MPRFKNCPETRLLLVWASCFAFYFSLSGGSPTPLQAITLDVRLACDLTGGCATGDFFFDHPEARTTLQFAAQAFEPFADQLTALPASPAWTARFTNPDTGAAAVSVSNLAVPANTLVLFAGGRDLAGNQVAAAGPGTADISLSRGQGTITGSLADDFATWGGSIALDTLDSGLPRNWHFGIDEPPAPGPTDFLTVAFHELAHLFGFGTSASFDNHIVAGQFQGTAVGALTGGAVPLAPDADHWASGTTSPPYAEEPLSALTPSLVLGRRRILTPLDFAALADLGWEVPASQLGLPGDRDADGDVDGNDLLRWQATTAAGSAGSLGSSGGDYGLWLWHYNYGQIAAPGLLATSTQAPEPTSLILAGWLAALFSGRRRK
jgi:hypothetical protein